MADGGAKNLRKQIAFLSNLIDKHKNAKCEENPVPKRSSSLKQSTSWSRWKTERTINKSKTQNKQLNQRQQGNMILNGTLSRNIQSARNVKGYVSSDKLSYRKVCTNKAAQLSSSRLQKSNTPTNITSRSGLNMPTISSLELQSKHRSLQKPVSNTTTQFHVSQLTNQQKSDQKVKNKLHRKISFTKSAPPSSAGHISSFKTTDQKVLTKIPLSSSYSGIETPFREGGINSSSGHSIKQQQSTARQPMVNLKWTKNENIYSRLPDSKSTAEKEGTSSNRIVVMPLTKNPLSSSFRHAKPLTKTVSLPATFTRNSPNHSLQNSTSTLDRITLLQKTHRTNSEATTNLAKSTVQPAVIPNGDKFKWTLKSASQLRKESSHKPSKTHRTDSKAAISSTKIISTTKTSIEPAVISQGAKLKWRRRSASQLGKDSKKNPKSKNLFGNDLQTRMALKSKWQRSKPSSTIRRTTVYSTSGDHIRTSVNHVPKNASGKRVIQSQHTKNILQLRTVSGRARLKWSKPLLQTAKNDQSSARKMKFAYKSRFSLKRRKSHEGKSLGVNQGSLGLSRVQHGAINRVKNQNRGFVARRMKYIALGSHTKSKSFASKYSLTKNAQLRKKITISGNHYVIGSHGKTLKKTVPINKTKFSTVAHKSSLHVYRKPVAVSSTNTIHRIFKRQISADKSKTKTANKILKRTLQNVQAVMKKVKKQKSEEYCMFYNKFGKCTKQKQGICPYIHDPTKIAVCTRFLRGKCQQMDGTCPFSHKIDKEKMPICQYFLKGKCNRDDCPYSHVNVGRQAVLCEDFLKGYCALGFKCKKKHVLECEEFSTTGQCPNGNKCRLIHRKRVQQRKRYFDEETLALDEEDNVRDLKKARRRSSDGFLPLEGSTIFEDERVNVTHLQTHRSQAETDFGVPRIRPNFTNKESSHEEQ